MADLIFNALNGTEMKTAILADIDKALTNTGEFEQHQTFPWVKYSFEVKLIVYPKQAMDSEPGIVTKGEGVTGHADLADTTDPPKQVEVQGTAVVETPDLVRLATNQPIPTTAPAGGVLVDKAVDAPPPMKQNRPGTFPKKEASGGGTK